MPDWLTEKLAPESPICFWQSLPLFALARVHFSMLSAQDASLCISMCSMFTQLSSVESAQCTQLGSFGSCWLTEDLAPVPSRAAQHPRHSCCTKQLGKSADNIRAIFQLWSANFLAVDTKSLTRKFLSVVFSALFPTMLHRTDRRLQLYASVSARLPFQPLTLGLLGHLKRKSETIGNVSEKQRARQYTAVTKSQLHCSAATPFKMS